jgi:hypothetical protein
MDELHHTRIVAIVLAISIALLASSIRSAEAQVPPRFYWKTLAGANAVPVIFQSLSGNANPLDPAHVVVGDAAFEATLLVPGYAKILPLFGRSALVAALFPMGRASAEATVDRTTIPQHASGYGDPMIEIGINVIGAKPIMSIPDVIRYEPKFSLDVIVDLAFPIGEYDDGQVVNLGQNRWYGRVGAPVVLQIGPWVPGRRTTFELFPSAWLFADNSNYLGGTLQTDPMYQAEGHLTRDLTETLWLSLDGTGVFGGTSTIDGHTGESLSNIGAGFTLGYQINDHLQATLGYMATLNDGEPSDLKMDVLRISLVYGWHKVIEGMGRLGSEE